MSRRFSLPPDPPRPRTFFPWLPFLAGLVLGVLLTVVVVFFAGVSREIGDSTRSAGVVPRDLIERKTAEETPVASDSADATAQNDSIESAESTPVETELDTSTVPAAKQVEPARQVHTGAIRVQILNGCGVRGIANNVAPALRSMGFDVRESGNAKNFRHEMSRVYDRSGKLANAYALADSVGIDSALVGELPDPDLFDIDVTLVVGSDYMSLKLGMAAQEGEN